MTGPLAHRAETQRLARVLGVAPEELDFLDQAPVEALAELRVGVLDRLLAHSRDEFERAVALGDKIPRGLAATLAEHAMGPVLGGRAAALLRAETAVALAERLPAEFLADVATHVDLRHVGPLVGGIPTEKMEETGRVLRAREEWIVLSAFVGHVPLAKLEKLLAVFDSEALLRGGFVLEDVSRLDAVVALLPDARIAELAAAAHELALWPETFALTNHLGPQQAERVLAAIELLPAERVDSLLEAAWEHDLWPEAIGVAAHVGEDGGAAILGAIERLAPDRLDALLAAAHREGLWPEVIAVTARIDPGENATVLSAIGRLEVSWLDALLEAAFEHDLWAEAIGLAAHVGADEGAGILAAIERLTPDRLDALLAAAHRDALWPEVIAVAAKVDAGDGAAPAEPQGGGAIIDAIGRLDADRLSELAEALRSDDQLREAAEQLLARAPKRLRTLVAAP